MKNVKWVPENSTVSNDAENFRLVMRRSGLSAREFGRSLGMSESHVSNILRGFRGVSREVLERLARVYDVDLNGFILGEGRSDAAYIEVLRQGAAAGRGIEIDEYAERASIAVPASFIAPHRAANVRAVFVAGDSMTGEKLYDGDTVLFDILQTEGEHIFVVSVGTTLLVKRVVRDGIAGSVTLLSANPAYPPRVISGADAEQVKVEGRVFGVLHRV
jgi:SOS-response transcriptional repressor LexA